MLLAACHLSLAADGDGGEAGWTSLFNGKNLDGWIVKCRPAVFVFALPMFLFL